MNLPRSLEYGILRCRERLNITEREFLAAPYERQLTWLAYDQLRQRESHTTPGRD